MPSSVASVDAEPLSSASERSRVCGDVDRVLAESIERNDLEGTLVSGREDDVGRGAIQVRSQPVGRSHAPPIARPEPRKTVLRHRRDEVVADPLLVLEKFGGDHGADRVAAEVLRTGATAAVTEEAGHGVGATRREGSSQHVEFGHPSSIAHSAD